jgi:hypothetical protein
MSISSFTSERDVIAFFIPGESFGFLRRERVVHDFSDAVGGGPSQRALRAIP